MIVMEQNDKIFRCNASKHQIFSFVLADATKKDDLLKKSVIPRRFNYDRKKRSSHNPFQVLLVNILEMFNLAHLYCNSANELYI